MAIEDVTAKTIRRTGLRRALVVGVVVSLALGLGGCGFGDIQFKGKVFDAMGMNSTSAKKSPKLAPRTGLITPPSLNRLPTPGEQQPQTNDAFAAINDPDRQKVETAESLARRQAEYCAKHYEPARARGDDSADSIEGPGGLCRRSVLTAIQKWSGQDQGQN